MAVIVLSLKYIDSPINLGLLKSIGLPLDTISSVGGENHANREADATYLY
jgi:hypothetical protein